MPDSPQLDEPPPPAGQKSAAIAQPKLVAVKPEMIIKGVLGRYERWNPVHPTAGAFWGMGLGLGFGPEVVGYVGAGCGVGFSVGFTLAGVGIGLPQPVFIKTHDHGAFPGNISLESARYYTAAVVRGLVWDAISYASQVVGVMKGSRQKLLRFQDNSQVSGGVDLPKLGKGVSSGVRSSDIRPGQ